MTWLEILTLALELIAGLVLLAAVWLAPRVLDLDGSTGPVLSVAEGLTTGPEGDDGQDQY